VLSLCTAAISGTVFDKSKKAHYLVTISCRNFDIHELQDDKLHGNICERHDRTWLLQLPHLEVLQIMTMIVTNVVTIDRHVKHRVFPTIELKLSTA
jgi:hypothetical protein